jgi:hypothetical protein
MNLIYWNVKREIKRGIFKMPLFIFLAHVIQLTIAEIATSRKK